MDIPYQKHIYALKCFNLEYLVFLERKILKFLYKNNLLYFKKLKEYYIC